MPGQARRLRSSRRRDRERTAINDIVMKNFREVLDNDRVYVFDGAVGTRLYDKGVYINRSYDELNIVAPDLVREVHEEYVKAGADIIETNSFGAARPKLQSYGLESKLKEIN